MHIDMSWKIKYETKTWPLTFIGSEIPCPPLQNSPTGFTPNCTGMQMKYPKHALHSRRIDILVAFRNGKGDNCQIFFKDNCVFRSNQQRVADLETDLLMKLLITSMWFWLLKGSRNMLSSIVLESSVNCNVLVEARRMWSALQNTLDNIIYATRESSIAIG